MAEDKVSITLWATSEEMDKVNSIKEFYQRNTCSDVIRFLINQEHKKILQENISIENNNKE